MSKMVAWRNGRTVMVSASEDGGLAFEAALPAAQNAAPAAAHGVVDYEDAVPTSPPHRASRLAKTKAGGTHHFSSPIFPQTKSSSAYSFQRHSKGPHASAADSTGADDGWSSDDASSGGGAGSSSNHATTSGGGGGSGGGKRLSTGDRSVVGGSSSNTTTNGHAANTTSTTLQKKTKTTKKTGFFF